MRTRVNLSFHAKKKKDGNGQIPVSHQEYVAVVGHLFLIVTLYSLMNTSTEVGSRKVTTSACVLTHFEFSRENGKRYKEENNCFLSIICCNCRAFMFNSEIISFNECI